MGVHNRLPVAVRGATIAGRCASPAAAVRRSDRHSNDGRRLAAVGVLVSRQLGSVVRPRMPNTGSPDVMTKPQFTLYRTVTQHRETLRSVFRLLPTRRLG